MADGFSVAASVVGIATAAVQSVQFLSTTIENIKGRTTLFGTLSLIYKQSNQDFIVWRQYLKAMVHGSSSVLRSNPLW